MKKFFKIIGGIIGGIIVIGIIGAVAGGNSSSSTPTKPTAVTAPAPEKATQAPKPTPAPSSPDDELKAMLQTAPAPVVKKDEISYDVTYTLTNNTKDSFDYVELDVDFYNKAGVKVDTGMVNTTHVSAGQKFELNVTTMKQDVDSYKVVGIYSSALHD